MGGLWSKTLKSLCCHLASSFCTHPSPVTVKPRPRATKSLHRHNYRQAGRGGKKLTRGKTSATNDITKILFIHTKKEHRKHKTNIQTLDNEQRATPLPRTSPSLCLMFNLQGAMTWCYCFKSNSDIVSIRCFYFWSLSPTGGLGKVAALSEKKNQWKKDFER